MVNGTVAFVNQSRAKPGLLELAVNVAGEHPRTFFGVSPLLEDAEPCMRNGLPVQIQPMPVEAPGQLWLQSEGPRVGDVCEVDLSLGESRLPMLPEPSAIAV